MTRMNRWLASLGSVLLPSLVHAQVYQTDDVTSSAGSGAAALGGLVFIGIMLVVGLAVFVFWLMMLIDVIRREFPNQNDKILWLVLIIIFGILGAIIYYFAGRSKGTIPAKPPPAAAASPTPPPPPPAA